MRPIYPILTLLIFISACQNVQKKGSTPADNTVYLEAGDSIATQAQQILLSNVKSALEKGGSAYAVEFCHEHALKLTDSISVAYKASVQRISSKNRNSNNAPGSPEEENLLGYFTDLKASGKPLHDTLFFQNNLVVYYKPILLGMPTCLKCHGEPGTDIDAETLSLLNTQYPGDKATNYKLGDLRGAWKITFPVQKPYRSALYNHAVCIFQPFSFYNFLLFLQ